MMQKEGIDMKRLIPVTLIAALVATGAAVGAEDQMSPAGQTPDHPQKQNGQESPAGTQMNRAAGGTEFITSQSSNDWLASSLIGRSVQRPDGELIGDINDVVLDQDGRAMAVLIGVGGFLGIGAKRVGVPYSALEFKERKIPDASPQRGGTPRPPQGLGQNSGNPLVDSTSRPVPREDARHSNMVIVLDMTEEQLEAAPAYVKIGETASAGSASEQGVNRETKEDQPKAR
jgi:sporulation protein YlmC with PRC-barrel domain